jgi:hypothetical protein
MSTVTYTFTYVDSIEGCYPVAICVGDGRCSILKNGHFVPPDSVEADRLFAQWARLKLGLIP